MHFKICDDKFYFIIQNILLFKYNKYTDQKYITIKYSNSSFIQKYKIIIEFLKVNFLQF